MRRILDMLTGVPPEGGSVSLTLNAKAQRAAYQGLAGRKGAVAAVNPTTGAILALVSSPSYDPNLLASHDPTVALANFEKLDKDPDKPMLDRALNETYNKSLSSIQPRSPASTPVRADRRARNKP